MRRPGALLATWFGAGLSPKAPGTAGSLAALPFGLAAMVIAGPYGVLGLAVAIFLIGLVATQRYIDSGDSVDPGEVVIDEVAGQLLPLTVAPMEILPWVAAFIMFRVADILKPWPCSIIDRKTRGALGVMGDDIAAGLYAVIGMLILAELGAW